MNRLFTAFIVGAMVLGVGVGWLVNQTLPAADAKTVADNLSIVTDVFLRLIKMIIAPLVFSTLVAGIAHMEDAASIGRVGVKTMAWFIGASIVSLSIGLLMVHLIQPGVGMGLVADAAQADVFAGEHADYVQLTTAVPKDTDSYWKALAKDKSKPSRDKCLTTFGAENAEPLLEARDFRVDAAFADHLVLSPRSADVTPELVTACFPTAQKYRLRTGKHWALVHGAFGFRHDVVAKGDKNECTRSCDPLRKWSRGRVFEISSVNEPGHCRTAGDMGDPLDLRVGCAENQYAIV